MLNAIKCDDNRLTCIVQNADSNRTKNGQPMNTNSSSISWVNKAGELNTGHYFFKTVFRAYT
jgi:hypothetical protein